MSWKIEKLWWGKLLKDLYGSKERRHVGWRHADLSTHTEDKQTNEEPLIAAIARFSSIYHCGNQGPPGRKEEGSSGAAHFVASPLRAGFVSNDISRDWLRRGG